MKLPNCFKNVEPLNINALKDMRANCFCAPLLRTYNVVPHYALSRTHYPLSGRNVEIYSASGHFSIYAQV